MSKSKSDLLVKVRYQNPLPAPPFPPKTLHIPTTPSRYSSYEFLNPLFNERELPFVLDGELGLPLELGKLEEGRYGDGGYWLGDRTGAAPSKSSAPPIDPEDLFLLEDVPIHAGGGMLPSTPGGGGGGVIAGSGVGERKAVNVSWLRKTEYLSADGTSKIPAVGGALTPKSSEIPLEELGREKRAARIAATFKTFEDTDLPDGSFAHPNKKHLKATGFYTLLPDEVLWANTLGLVRFGEDPGDVKAENRQQRLPRSGPDPRTPRALFRPLEAPGEAERISYYLPTDEHMAVQYERKRRHGAADEVPKAEDDEEFYDFKYVRDYEVSARRPLEREYILTFDEGSEGGEITKKRSKGAYYASLGQLQTLRKRRPKKGEKSDQLPQALLDEGIQFWDGIAVKVGDLDTLDEEDREDRIALENEVLVAPPLERLS